MKHCALLFLSLAFVGCAPPYNAELNSAAPLAKQMTVVGTVGPVNINSGNATTSVKFLPVKPTAPSFDALSVESGFLVSRTDNMESLSLASFDSNGKVQTSNSNQGFPLGADSTYPLYEYDVISSTATTGRILVFRMDPTPTASTVQLFTADLANGSFQSPTMTSNPQPLTVLFPPVLSVQVFPLLPPSTDRFNFLFDNGTPLDGEGTAAFDGLTAVFGTGSPSVSNGSISFPGTQKRVLFYNNGQSGSPSRSYASYYEAGQWVCYRWNLSAAPATLLSGITHRIDALLTTGDLISTDGGTLRVYDSNGSQVTSVPLGAIQFCYEAYVGPTPYVFFSMSMGLPHNNWAFRVYAIETSTLKDLKG